MRRFAPYAATFAAAVLVAVGVQNAGRAIPDSCPTPVTSLGEADAVVDAVNAYMADKVEQLPGPASEKAVADAAILNGAFQDEKGKPAADRVSLAIILYRGSLNPIPFEVVVERGCDGWKVTEAKQMSPA